MKFKLKKLTALLLAMAMSLSLLAPAYAAEEESDIALTASSSDESVTSAEEEAAPAEEVAMTEEAAPVEEALVTAESPTDPYAEKIDMGQYLYADMTKLPAETKYHVSTDPDDYVYGDSNTEIGYYYTDDPNAMDFEVMLWDKAKGETLRSAVEEELKDEYGDKAPEYTIIVLNNTRIAYYNSIDTDDDGKQWPTLTALVDAGDKIAEFVFWCDGPDVGKRIADIESVLVASGPARYEAQKTIKMGAITADLTQIKDVVYYISTDKNEYTFEDEIGYYFTADEKALDFEVMVWDKAKDETIFSAVEEELKAEYGDNAPDYEKTELNGIQAVNYRNVDDDGDGNLYKTSTWLLDAGGQIAEIVFWLENEEEDSARIADVLKTLSIEKKDSAENSSKLNAGAKAVMKGSKAVISWGKVAEADGYDVFLSKCNGKSFSKKATTTVKKNSVTSVTISKLSTSGSYKVRVKAYRMVDGKKVYVATGKVLHFCGSKAKTTNPKKITVKKKAVTLKVKKSANISASITKESKKKLIGHTAKLRYWSSNAQVASVNQHGKITAVAQGSCTIYVMGENGVKTSVKVTVK